MGGAPDLKSMKFALSKNDDASFIKRKDIKLVGDKLITIPKKKKNGFFHVEIDVPEEEIDELLSDACCALQGQYTSRRKKYEQK